ncbi:hypothetical protein ACFVXC_38050 [Streptomyces sp. NPDC058257]|uniref:hypothetical protein n=1 Tax=Streptomyces sp. NPDC058257 TaxID=3346409 RepID=UPI0036F10E28
MTVALDPTSPGARSSATGPSGATGTGTGARNLPIRLAGLVGDTDAFFGEVWNIRPASFHCRALPDAPAPADLWERDPAAQERFAAGESVCFDAPGEWLPGIADLVTALREDLWASGARAALVLSPPGTLAPPPSAEADHAFVLQLDGSSSWDLAYGRVPVTITLHRTSAVYLPPGHACPSAVGDQDSLQLVLSVQEAGAREVAERAIAAFLRAAEAAPVPRMHPAVVDEKVGWLRAQLAGLMPGQDVSALVRRALGEEPTA